jgi:cytochrome c556
MKSLLLPAALLLAVTFSTARAADTELEGSMKRIKDASKQLDTDLKLTDDTKHAKDADLKSVATLKDEAVKSRALVPKRAQALPPDQQATMTQNYQKDMDAFGQDIETLNQDIQSDKWDPARADFKKLLADEDSGHKAYRMKKQ